MKIYVSQIYIEAGVNFPFTHIFQGWIGEKLSSITEASESYKRRYGEDFNLIFRMSAKAGINETEIKGPTVFKKTKDVEYSIFLPFITISVEENSLELALRYLLAGVIEVLDRLEIDSKEVARQTESIVAHIISEPSMIKPA